MSERSGYNEDGDNWAVIRWRGAVASSLRGKRGQLFLQDAARVLDALPEHKLTEGEFEYSGEYCLLGAVAVSRGIDVSELDYEDAQGVAEKFNISEAMAREIMHENDNCVWDINGEHQGAKRWLLMRDWVNRNTQLKVAL